jgi:YidC/Oxa1 family membrane protein insertase
MNRNRRILLLVITVALVFVLSACGGGSSGMYEEPIGAQGGWGWLQWIITHVADFTYWVSLQLGGHFWLGLIVVTLIVRSAGWPIYAKSNAMTTNMQQAQPELDKIKEKYNGRTDEVSQKKMQQETVEIYRKYGINPLGCLLPFLQMPIFIAMYQVVRRLPLSAGKTLDGVVTNSIRNYQDLNFTFLGMDLKGGVDFAVFSTDGIWAGLGAIFPEIILAILVGILMFGYQRYAQSKPDYLQNKKYQTAQASQTANQMKYFSYVMVFMLVSIAVTNNAIALYWIVGNSFQFLQTYINRMQTKKKFLETKNNGSVVR